MNIAKALKKKNQLVGEISKLSQTISRENVQLNQNVSRFDIKAIYEQYKDKANELVVLKAAIARANADVWVKVFMLVELKGRVTFLRSIDNKEGSFKERTYTEAVDNVYKPILNAKFLQDEIDLLEKRIADIQDDVDNYNHITEI